MQSTGNSNGGMKRRSIAGRIFRRNRRNKTEDVSIVTEQEPSTIDRQHVKFVEGQQAPPQQQEYVENNMMRKSILQTGISPKATATPTQRVSMSEIVSSMPKSWITKTKFFRNMIDAVFTDIDGDGSGDIDEKELYSGLLLIHLKLGAYAGPAACKVRKYGEQPFLFLKEYVDSMLLVTSNLCAHSYFVIFQCLSLLPALFPAHFSRQVPRHLYENGCRWIWHIG
jgi:hypothetical protein